MISYQAAQAFTLAFIVSFDGDNYYFLALNNSSSMSLIEATRTYKHNSTPNKLIMHQLSNYSTKLTKTLFALEMNSLQGFLNSKAASLHASIL